MATHKSSSSNFSLEEFINVCVQRFFPLWYAGQAAKEVLLPKLDGLNPIDYHAEHWLSVGSAHSEAQRALPVDEPIWQPLMELLPKIVVEKEFHRTLSVTALHGVLHTPSHTYFDNLIHYAQQHSTGIPCTTDEDFMHCISQAFPPEKEPCRVHYREWDGRYYLNNQTDPKYLGAILLQCQQEQRHYSLPCIIHVDSVHEHSLNRLRAGYWMLLMKREQAYQIYQLIHQAQLPCDVTQFENRRDDLAFLIAPKSHSDVNRIMLNLLKSHNATQLLDWGRFLSRAHFPFKNQ